MISSRLVSGFASAALVFALQALPAQAGPLGDFNVMTFGDFSANSSDVEGRVYAGGNVSLNSYSVGYTLSGDMVGGDSLVVGGNLNFGYGSVNHGNVVVGGSSTITDSFHWTMHNAGLSITSNVGVAGLPVDFTAEYARLSAISTGLAALGATGTSEYKWGQIFLTGAGADDIEVFTISAADLAASNTLNISGVEDGKTVIVNVTGATASMSGGLDQFFERNRENVIFNFFEADTLSLANIGVQGSILAVDADINSSWGVIWGQVVANNWNGPMQVNEVYYGGTVPGGSPTPTPNPVDDPIAVNAPAAAGLMLLGLVALAGLRRRSAPVAAVA
ncbi:MAG: choice-of-anchor A family protein [Rhodospirillaceae bacterium]